MKKFLLIFILFFFQNNAFSKNIVYLDIQYIIDNSDLGILYKSKINKLVDNNKENLQIKKNEIKLKEKEINNQKNLLSKEEIEKKIVSLNKLVKNYQIDQNKKNKLVIDEKKIYTSKILKLINPLLTNYVEKNKITLVVDKKNILVGIKSLDITPDILKILNDETKKNNLLNNEE
tara:strand:- start:1109 stop:1633 length:525 start_codon:yes stop_codon:yes gene_type:complete